MELPGYGLWNISRGLARDQKNYRSHLRQADTPRQGDYDGKGSLTTKGLEQFVDYMLDTALDQVNYMGTYLRLDGLAKRMELFVMRINDGLVLSEPKPLPAHADKIFKHLLLHGECTRGEVRKVIGKSESLATKLTKHLLEREFVVSDTPRGAIRLKINASMASYLFPELVPEEI
jgi:Fic family protein